MTIPLGIAAGPATLFALLLIHFCSPTPMLNALAPRDGITLTSDIAYSDGPRHTLDVYAARQTSTPAPVLMFFYGGGWASGSKQMIATSAPRWPPTDCWS
jgi:acetyl esterase/lipase